MPAEFQILPDPTDIFEEKKAIEEVIKLEQQRAQTLSRTTQDLDTVTELNRKSASAVSISNIGGTTNNLFSNSGSHPQSILKNSTKVAPGVLSNNLRQSHLMKIINKQHEERVQQMERLEQKKQYYMQSPHGRQSNAGSMSRRDLLDSFGGSFRYQHESFITDSYHGGPNKMDNQSSNSSMSTSQIRLGSLKQKQQVLSKNPSSRGPVAFKRAKNMAGSRRCLFSKLKAGASRNNGRGMQANELINFDLVQIRNFPGVNIFTDPIYTTQRLYKEVL